MGLFSIAPCVMGASLFLHEASSPEALKAIATRFENADTWHLECRLASDALTPLLRQHFEGAYRTNCRVQGAVSEESEDGGASRHFTRDDFILMQHLTFSPAGLPAKRSAAAPHVPFSLVCEIVCSDAVVGLLQAQLPPELPPLAPRPAS